MYIIKNLNRLIQFHQVNILSYLIQLKINLVNN